MASDVSTIMGGVLVVAAVLAISGVGPTSGPRPGPTATTTRRVASCAGAGASSGLGEGERVRPRRRAEALARRRPGGPAGAARAVPHTRGLDVRAVGQRRRWVALRQVVGRGARLLIGQVRGGPGVRPRVLAADAAGLRGPPRIIALRMAAMRAWRSSARDYRLISTLARGLVAREAVEG